MKNILFMAINMNIGGMEKALLNLLSEIPRDKYNITLLMLEEYGGFLDYIPNGIRVKYLKNYAQIKRELNNPPKLVAKEYLKNGKLIRAFNIIFFHICTKVLKDRSLYFRYVLRKYPIIDEEYDVAVAYAGPMEFISYYVTNKIRAKKKIQWIHFDTTKIYLNEKFTIKTYKKFDKIFVVSKEAKDKLEKLIPSIQSKTKEFYNIISSNLVRQMSYEGKSFEDNFNGVRILTVGRLSKEKGQHLTIPVLARLKNEGYNVRWYCVGEGNSRNEYEELVRKYKVEEDYIFLGASTNPYSFMRDCDIYVQPSIHEGYCITLAEARCFDNPIVTTNFTGATEQISHGESGLISQCNENDIYLNIKRLLDDKELKKHIKLNLRKENVDTVSEVEKLYEVIEGKCI